MISSENSVEARKNETLHEELNWEFLEALHKAISDSAFDREEFLRNQKLIAAAMDGTDFEGL